MGACDVARREPSSLQSTFGRTAEETECNALPPQLDDHAQPNAFSVSSVNKLSVKHSSKTACVRDLDSSAGLIAFDALMPGESRKLCFLRHRSE